MEYFQPNLTVDELKRRYFQLAKLHHPDLGGDLRTMQAINHQYEHRLSLLDGTHYTEFSYKYNSEAEQALMQKIQELISEDMFGVDITLIGSWLWLTGNTKAHKDALKRLGCKWHREKECWFWHFGKWRGKASRSSLGELAGKYGSQTFKNNWALDS